MNLFNLTLITLIILSTVVTVTIAVWANLMVKKANQQVKYYQLKSTQCKIANHVIRNNFYRDGGEVFR